MLLDVVIVAIVALHRSNDLWNILSRARTDRTELMPAEASPSWPLGRRVRWRCFASPHKNNLARLWEAFCQQLCVKNPDYFGFGDTNVANYSTIFI